MKKYRITPAKRDLLGELLKGSALPERELNKLTNACTIEEVVVTPQIPRWEIVLHTEQLIEDALLAKAGDYIKKSCNVTEVIITDAAVTDKAAADSGEGATALDDFAPTGDAAYDPPTDADFAAPTDFEYVPPSDFDYVPPGDDDFMPPPEPDYAPPVELSPPKPHAKKTAKKDGESSGSQGDYAPPVELPAEVSAKNLIFGKSTAGEITAIGAIEGEMKSVVVKGTIGEGENYGIKTREFQTGTNLLSFGLADDTDGISCKKFFKQKEKDEFAEVVKKLKGGEEVRVKGSVRYDTYQNEYVLFADSLSLTEKKVRKDTAEVKRVELHAHTVMSMMDAVMTASQLVTQAAEWGMKAVAITDHGVVQAFPDAMNAKAKLKKSGKDIKVIYGMEGYLSTDLAEKSSYHIILLAKNSVGLRNLYRLVSLSHLRFFGRRPRIPKELLKDYRDGLIVGSACEAGELIRAIVRGDSEEKLINIAAFYDYLEIQPLGNNAFLKRSDKFPAIKTDEDLINVNLRVADLAKKLGKPLVATCDAHFMNQNDAIYRAILMAGKGFDDADMQPPLYFRTTDEMLDEFPYLSKEDAYEAVITNPGKIADMIDDIKPIPDDLYSPAMPGAAEEIRAMSYKKARELYGDPLPKIVADRLEQELTPIIGHGFSALYLIAQKLVEKSMRDGYLVGSRGSVGSSFVATMTGITEVNPLPPHYRCAKCKHTEFVQDGSVGCGYDLPNKNCPQCGEKMIKDGHEIPFAVFLGFDGDKVPDIDLNFSGVYQPTAHKFTEIMFGRDFAYRAGTIATVAEKTAYGFVMKYYEGKGQRKHRAFIEKQAKGCQGVKRTTGQHPAGIMVVPRDMDIHFFTPVQHPADDKSSTTITTHFDYHSISSRLVKLDILGHDDPTMIKMLEDLTHLDAKDIPFDDPETQSIFTSPKALGITAEELGTDSGAYGIPEFRTGFTRQMIDDAKPDCFSDLVRISGFSHGTDVWLGNAQDLINNGTCTLKNAISARDDIMVYLMHHGIEPLLSFKTMENVRKGKGIAPEVVEKLRAGGIPEWYIESCQKIKYLFPRAHATAYVMMAWRIAYCKVHYPLAFYAAYFSIRADEFDANVIAKGKDYVKGQLDALEKKAKETKLDVKESGTLIVLQLAWEMYLRGFAVRPVSLYESAAFNFQIMPDNTLLPPFAALPGVGPSAAEALAEAAKKGEFSSVEDIRKRSGVNKTCIEALTVSGCLAGLPENDEISLF